MTKRDLLLDALVRRCQRISSEEYQVTLWSLIQHTIEDNGGIIQEEGLGFVSDLVLTSTLIAYDVFSSLICEVRWSDFAETLGECFDIIIYTANQIGEPVFTGYIEIRSIRANKYLKQFEEACQGDEPPEHEDMVWMFTKSWLDDFIHDIQRVGAVDLKNMQGMNAAKGELFVEMAKEVSGAMDEFIRVTE